MARSTTAHAVLAALLGASLVLATPGASEAKPKDKWWTPKESGRRERRVERTYSHSPSRGFSRQWRSWRGQRVYRDVIVIRDVSRGPRYSAWRAYCPPEYSYSRRVIRVRPIRFYVAASAVIGRVRINARYHDYDDDCLYGCNFCDARFRDYGNYQAHVYQCSHRPHGYRVECSDWDAPSDGGWWDDRNWEGDRDYRDYRDSRDRDDRDYQDRDYGYRDDDGYDDGY